jgi:hypothetical protein
MPPETRDRAQRDSRRVSLKGRLAGCRGLQASESDSLDLDQLTRIAKHSNTNQSLLKVRSEACPRRLAHQRTWPENTCGSARTEAADCSRTSNQGCVRDLLIASGIGTLPKQLAGPSKDHIPRIL